MKSVELGAGTHSQHFPASRARHGFRNTSRCVLAGLALVTVACHDGGSLTQPVPKPNDRLDTSLLTGAALTHLNANGQFDLASHDSSAAAEIAPSTARAIARIWVREFAPFSLGALEAQRQGPIDVAHLRPCGRVFYAESPYFPLSASLDAPMRRRYGPWYLVSMCAPDSTAEISVAVSAYNTEIQIVNDQLVLPSAPNTVRGNEVVMEGIPPSIGGTLPLTPEQAATMVARLSGNRVSQVPELLAPIGGTGIPPQFARWHITLENSARARGRKSGVTYQTSDLYLAVTGLRIGAQLLVALANQPSETVSHQHVVIQHHLQEQSADIVAARRADRPVLFEPADIVP